jgi:hypothetical protein
VFGNYGVDGYINNRGAGSLLFFNNNAERMRILSGGSVGINTSNPTTTLTVDVKSNSYVNGIDISNSNDWGYGSSINFRAIPTSGGSLATVSRIQQFYEGSNQYGLSFSTYNAGLSERMRITAAGNFLVGTTADISTGGTSVARACFDSGSGQNGMKVKLNNTSYAAYISTTTGSDHYFGYMNNSAGTNVGSILCTNTTTTYSTSSDYRLKENIQPMTGALSKVQALNPVTYTWKADGSSSQGFIAHELQAVVPECVTGEKDAVNEDGSIKPQGIDTSFLVATLTKAIQEQQAMIEELKARIETLEAK